MPTCVDLIGLLEMPNEILEKIFNDFLWEDLQNVHNIGNKRLKTIAKAILDRGKFNN